MNMTTSNAQTPGYQRLTEELFFEGVDELIVRRLRDEANSPEGRSTLLAAIGTQDEMLAKELADLAVTSHCLIAMRLVPLVLVAWSDYTVTRDERRAILQHATELGVKEDSAAGALLLHWLSRIPPGEIVDAWKRTMRVELENMSSLGVQKLRSMLQTQMYAVARASGGIIGLGNVSHFEKQMIDGLLRMFDAAVSKNQS